jgi:hypothetical protein
MTEPCGKPIYKTHCPSCHETFGGVNAFDLHRVGEHDPYTRRCLTPDEMLALRTKAGEPLLFAREEGSHGTVWGRGMAPRAFIARENGPEGAEDDE